MLVVVTLAFHDDFLFAFFNYWAPEIMKWKRSWIPCASWPIR